MDFCNSWNQAIQLLDTMNQSAYDNVKRIVPHNNSFVYQLDWKSISNDSEGNHDLSFYQYPLKEWFVRQHLFHQICSIKWLETSQIL